MAELFPPSLADQIACVEREIKYRERVYARLVEQEKMKPSTATLEMSRMKAVLETLQRLAK